MNNEENAALDIERLRDCILTEVDVKSGSDVLYFYDGQDYGIYSSIRLEETERDAIQRFAVYLYYKGFRA